MRSRRITEETRIVYRVVGDRKEARTLEIASCRRQYG
jgi:Txe/YoeB family toxin of Txe-Axe toxin-antitoxin module